ncbi:MAG: arylsulfatase, partial [bacterium]|nr:arylsulfatase [bacterium]
MNKPSICSAVTAVIALVSLGCSTGGGAPPPNIVFILADDLGYGDVGCYNPESKVPTPNIDRLAGQGMRFTDAHSPSTVCTPTRYSLMTGRMEFRTGMKGVFPGVEGPALIEEGRLTLPQMLRERGYTTACFGKWHIGMTFLNENGTPVYEVELPAGTPEERRRVGVERVRLVDFSKPIPDGPIHRGFDHFFGTVSCPTTDWLYAWVDGDRVPVPPTGLLDRTPLPKHPYSTDNRRGMIAPDFDLEEVDLVFLNKSVEFLENHVRESPGKPFFLFHSAQAVHLPSFPADAYKGKTEAGPHGDFIFELDHIVGELMSALDRLGLAQNTLVIFSSDNGPTYAGGVDYDFFDSNGPLRGLKGSLYEGGIRVPTIARWPGTVPAGSRSARPAYFGDVLATACELVGLPLPEGRDSLSFLATLKGEKNQPIAPYLYWESYEKGGKQALRMGKWKAVREPWIGGEIELFDVQADIGEAIDRAGENPEIVQQVEAYMEAAHVRSKHWTPPV